MTDEDIELRRPQTSTARHVMYAVVLSPVVIVFGILVSVALMLVTGVISTDIAVGGTIAAEVIWRTLIVPFAVFLFATYGFLWIVVVMAMFGANGVMKIGQSIHRMIRDYNG